MTGALNATREPEFTVPQQIDKLRREFTKLARARFTGWFFITMHRGEVKMIEQDTIAVVDTNHPLWPVRATDAAPVPVDDALSTVAACLRDRFYGQAAIPIREGLILTPPMTRGSKLIRDL